MVSKFNFEKLVVVRHGECQHNVAGRYAGQYDSPLTEKGRQQAKRAAALIQHHVPDIREFSCVSSSLGRARITAEIILANIGMDERSYVTDDRLLELNFGDHTNQPSRGIRAFLAENAPGDLLWKYAHPNGESFSQLYERVGALLTELPSDTLLVCHSGPARAIRAHILGINLREAMDFTLENGATLIYRGESEERI